MPNTLTEGRHAGEFIIESCVALAHEQITVLAGQVLEAGHVVGKVTLGAATPAAVAGNTGNGTLATATVGLGGKVGVYRAVCIEPAANLGKFLVANPDGVLVGVATVGTEFVGGGLTFTIADGATDFVSGDQFTITVAAGSGKVREYNPANTDGSAVPAGILYAAVDATGADRRGAIVVRLPHTRADGGSGRITRCRLFRGKIHQTIIQARVTLQDIAPPIWRGLLLPPALNLAVRRNWRTMIHRRSRRPTSVTSTSTTCPTRGVPTSRRYPAHQFCRRGT